MVPAIRFFLWVLALAWVAGLPAAAATHGALPSWIPVIPLQLVVLCSPAIVAATLAHRAGGRLDVRRLFGTRRQWALPTPWYLVGTALPFAINAAALGIYAILGGEGPGLAGALAPEQEAIPLPLLAVTFLVLSLAEELGWRAYALPQLQRRFTALTASVAIGVAWGLWHLPLTLTADSTQSQLPFWWYMVQVVAASVVFTWLYNSTGGSLAAVTVLHASTQLANIVLPVANTSVAGPSPYHIVVVTTVVVAVALVALSGPRHLGQERRPRPLLSHPRTRQRPA